MKILQIKKGAVLITKRITYAVLLGLMVLLVPSCTKDKTTSTDKAKISVRMTDALGNYDAVNIDVQGVEIIGSEAGTVSLNTHSRIYNILNFSNGLDTLIASGDLNAGTVSQIRLILGANNTVKVNGVVYPLSTPSAQQSGLKLQIHQTFEPGVAYMILLDFDASQSIVLTGNGTYQLKPVIRTIETAITGSIKGSISTTGKILTVTATSNGVSYSSVTNLSGAFLIAGLPAGTYDITITPALPLLPVTVIGKTVAIGVSTNIGIVAIL